MIQKERKDKTKGMKRLNKLNAKDKTNGMQR